MAKVKGTALKSTVEFLKQQLGDEGFDKLTDGMAPGELDILKAPVLLSSWYEFSLLRNLMNRAEGKLSLPPGRTLAWELGRHSAEATLSSIYKLFFKVADVSYIIKKAAYLFPTYYDTGAMEVLENSPGASVIHIKGFDEPSAEFCDRMQGWMQRTVELTGRKNVTLHHPLCVARGDAVCEYRGSWD